MLDLGQFLRLECSVGQRFKDECANLAASIGRMHLCPSIATVATRPSAPILLQNNAETNRHGRLGFTYRIAIVEPL
jgi:hypothetical protein